MARKPTNGTLSPKAVKAALALSAAVKKCIDACDALPDDVSNPRHARKVHAAAMLSFSMESAQKAFELARKGVV